MFIPLEKIEEVSDIVNIKIFRSVEVRAAEDHSEKLGGRYKKKFGTGECQ